MTICDWSFEMLYTYIYVYIELYECKRLQLIKERSAIFIYEKEIILAKNIQF